MSLKEAQRLLGEVKMLTGDHLMIFLLVVVAITTLFILFVNAAEAMRKLKRPQEKKEDILESRQSECAKMFDRDFKRLNEHSERIEAVEETTRVLCTGMHALLEHELHNGNADEMRQASAALFDHLNR